MIFIQALRVQPHISCSSLQVLELIAWQYVCQQHQKKKSTFLILSSFILADFPVLLYGKKKFDYDGCTFYTCVLYSA